jgi:hypothetical protein
MSNKNENNNNNLRKVLTKMMTVDKGVEEVFDFFENIKNMEIGGAIKISNKRRRWLEDV